MRGVELRHCFGAFRHGVLRQLSWKDKTHRGLYRPRVHGVLVVVFAQTPGFGRKTLEGVLHERVHDRHRLLRHSHLRVYLLQDFVDVDVVALFRGAPLSGLARATTAPAWLDRLLVLNLTVVRLLLVLGGRHRALGSVLWFR